jgi:hypothetical protein
MLYFFIICLISLVGMVVYITEVRSSNVAVDITGILNFSLSLRQILEDSIKTSHRRFLTKTAS